MAALAQYDYIFALGMIFAFLDAWNIGANDVANSFATSVSSRSITLSQAMMIATVMEFTGAVAVGSRVADTIRNKVVKIDYFFDQPGVLMLGMLCALIGSSTWLSIATAFGMPVSTTHCIVGGVIGMGVATLGKDGVAWGWDDKGVAQIIASWVIAPAIAGAFASVIFLATKYAVMKRKNPLMAGFIMVPIYFGITSGILTMLIVWKGAPDSGLDEWGAAQLCGTIFGVAAAVMLFVILFMLPFLYRKLALEDWTIKWYHFFLGPMLMKRGPVPEPPAGVNVSVVKDYYEGRATREDLDAANLSANVIADMEHMKKAKDLQKAGVVDTSGHGIAVPTESDTSLEPSALEQEEKKDVGPWYKPRNMFILAKKLFFHGVNQDVVNVSQGTGAQSKLTGDIMAMHARAAHFDNKTEHLYSFLQVLTAATASFAHGSNDVANAVGPLATIYFVWQKGDASKEADVPIWVLCYGASAIVIGLWTYGYNMMKQLGNRLTLQSPSRGFSMELGAAVTVVMATKLAIPVSTTQCIIGAVMGVALCNGDLRALNWRMVAWCYSGWIITLPTAGIISGCIMGFVINAPHWVKPAGL